MFIERKIIFYLTPEEEECVDEVLKLLKQLSEVNESSISECADRASYYIEEPLSYSE